DHRPGKPPNLHLAHDLLALLAHETTSEGIAKDRVATLALHHAVLGDPKGCVGDVAKRHQTVRILTGYNSRPEAAVASIDLILDELTRESETTKRILARVPTQKLDWRPHEKSRTLGELAWHLATIPSRIAAMAQVDDADAHQFKQPPRPDSAEKMAEQ